MATTLTIKPAGGGDYPDAATWEADLGTGDQIGECYRGDIGAVFIDDASPDSIVLAAAAGEQHQGALSGTPNSFANCTGSSTIDRSNVTVRGLYCHGGGAFATGFGATTRNNTILDKLLVHDAALQIDALAGANTTGCAIRNCVCYYGGGFAAAILATCNAAFGGSETTGLTIAIENNSVYCDDTSPWGIAWDAATYDAGDTVDLTLTLRNNVVIGGATADFAQGILSSGGPGTENISITSATNASGDATADDFGGTGHLTSQTSAACFTSTSNLALKAGAPPIDAGTTIAAVTTDILGVARPQGAAYDIGAFERVPSTDTRRMRLRGFRFGGSLRA